MVQKQATSSKKSAGRQKCRHYWMIETPAGRTSRGVCALCGAQQEFRNYLRDCLEGREEEYQQWRRRQGYGKQEKGSEDVLSKVGGGDKRAVKARS